MKKLTFLITLLAIVSASIAQTFNEWKDPVVNQVNRLPMRSHYFAYETNKLAQNGKKELSSNFLSINGQWKFNWVENADQRPLDFFQPNFNDSKWINFPVPGNWEIYGYGDPVYVNMGYPWRNFFNPEPPLIPIENNHVGSYRRTVEISKDWNNKTIIAHFGAVSSNMYLWVNGKFVGYSEDSKLAAEFDITKFVKPGKNLIAFQVYRWCDGSYLEDQDFWRLSGVARDCYLYARNTKRIEDIRVVSDLVDNYTNGKLDIKITSSDILPVKAELKDNTGKTIYFKELFTKKGVNKISFDIENPSKWTAETPNLYTLFVSTTVDNHQEIIPIKTGFRKIEIKNSQLLVNGQAVLFKGVNRHEMDPDGGYVVSKERMLQDVKVMKGLNINAVRTCHYPDDPYWYELCDQYGLYMVAEANLETHGMGYGDKTIAKDPQYALAHIQRNERNVQRNFNFPSIIFWSLGNEAGFGPNFEAAYKWVKNEDKSRPVQYERAPIDFTDIYCPMYLGYAGAEKYSIGNTPKPLIQCEYAHAMGNSMGGFKEYWDLIRKYPKYQGGFIWDFVDQSLRKKDASGKTIFAYGGDYNNVDASDNNFLNNGVVNPDRNYNPHAYEVQYFYQNIWVEALDLKAGKFKITNENFFTDLSNVYLEWIVKSNGNAISKSFSTGGYTAKWDKEHGIVITEGMLDSLDIAAQQSQEIQLDIPNLSDIEGEITIDFNFKLKKSNSLLEAGYKIAKAQFILQDYSFPALASFKSKKSNQWENKVIDNALVISNDSLQLSFDNKTGWLKSYQFGSLKSFNFKPNFWRAPTDNDYGANLQKKWSVWKNPLYDLKSVDIKKGENLQISFDYEIKDVKASLKLTYLVDESGQLLISQELNADTSAHISNMFRFGLSMEMPQTYSYLDYYGRGPFENYIDRNNSSFLGKYMQTVDNQFYSYIRPQENGYKTDVRYLNILDQTGNGLRFTSNEAFGFSALNYSQDSLDDGDEKDQRHSELVEKSDRVYLNLDKSQTGLGCVTSWGALPLLKYITKYESQKFNLLIQPLVLK